MADRPLILSIVVAYLLACIAIGIWASRRTHSAEDFFVAGKRMGIRLKLKLANSVKKIQSTAKTQINEILTPEQVAAWEAIKEAAKAEE